MEEESERDGGRGMVGSGREEKVGKLGRES